MFSWDYLDNFYEILHRPVRHSHILQHPRLSFIVSVGGTTGGATGVSEGKEV